jgi:hypothetical protein
MFLVDLSRHKAYNVENFSCFYYVKNRIYIGTEYNEATVAEYDSENDCAKAFYKIVTQMSKKGTKLVFAPTQIEVDQW